MKIALLGVALAAVPLFAAGQSASPSPHAGHGQAQAEAATKTEARPDAAGRDRRAFKSSFEGYRSFNAQEPARGWRAANEEVREAGGHAGVLKGTKGQAEAHDKVKP